MGKHSKEKNGKIIKFNLWLFLFRIISIIIILIALYAIFNWYKENQSSKALLDSAMSNVDVNKLVIDTNEYTVLDVDFNNLLQTNDETIGWIYLENSSINYPVVKASDNNFYLKHTLDKSYNTAGWIFADYRCASDFSSKNTTIYGHNRRDSSMFATLKNVINEDWYSKSKYLTVATPEGNRIYEVFSTYKVKAETYYSIPDFATDEEYMDFLNTIKGRSVHDFGVSLNSLDSIVTLSTCANDNTYRVVLHAKLITIVADGAKTENF